MKTTNSKSKMVKFSKVENLTLTSKSIKSFNPADIIIATTLYSIEKDISKIKL